MENLKTSYLDPRTGRQIFYLRDDKFSILIRKGNNKKTKRSETYSVNLPLYLESFHDLILPKNHRKYLVRTDNAGNNQTVYVFNGQFTGASNLVASKEPQPRSLTHKEMKRCNIIIHTLPEKLLNEVMTYNYDNHYFPNQNHRAYLLKIMLGYFFSLKEEDKIIFTRRARLRFEEYLQEVTNDPLELL